mmetsp:Transcript_15981/g.67356  ORF Transcript_15981/g.67356 Transcript_15981/m.67356 type:complete len:245 (-) Transcript_15981:419-1153(-)
MSSSQRTPRNATRAFRSSRSSRACSRASSRGLCRTPSASRHRKRRDEPRKCSSARTRWGRCAGSSRRPARTRARCPRTKRTTPTPPSAAPETNKKSGTPRLPRRRARASRAWRRANRRPRRFPRARRQRRKTRRPRRPRRSRLLMRALSKSPAARRRRMRRARFPKAPSERRPHTKRPHRPQTHTRTLNHKRTLPEGLPMYSRWVRRRLSRRRRRLCVGSPCARTRARLRDWFLWTRRDVCCGT